MAAPMLVLGVFLVAWYAVQVYAARRQAAAERCAEGRVAVLEKAD